jgi:phosphoribosyl 1,2-cyclic phosphate phosphodiesterase
MLGCDCDTCRSSSPKNHRYRSSVLIQLPRGNVLIDTGPEMRLQLLRERIGLVHAVLYTHYHADHTMGLDDLRLFPRYLGESLPAYCTEEVEQVIRRTFPYAFQPEMAHLPPGSIPRLVFRRIVDRPFEVLDERVTPIPLVHARFDVMGFRIGNVAYCTDVNEIPNSSWPLLEGLDVLVLDCLRPKPHPAHFCLQESLAVVARVRPKQTYLTHLGHEMHYERMNHTLPKGVEMAYDGLQFTF